MQLGILQSSNQMTRLHYGLKKSSYANMVLKVHLVFSRNKEKQKIYGLRKLLWTVVYCKGGANMARITVEEVYIGEKYGVMSAVMAEYLRNGRPAEHDERTWVEMLIVKHALIAADKMKLEGDSISGMTDAKSFSSYVRWNAYDNT